MRNRWQLPVATVILCATAWIVVSTQEPSTARDALADVTGQTAVEFGDMTFLPGKRELTVGLRVRNGAEKPLLRPFRLDIFDVQSKLGSVMPTSTSLDFSDAIPARGLPHADATADKTIVFEFPGDRPLPIDRNRGEVLTMTFRVTARIAAK
jgi:hypothetical protein